MAHHLGDVVERDALGAEPAPGGAAQIVGGDAWEQRLVGAFGDVGFVDLGDGIDEIAADVRPWAEEEAFGAIGMLHGEAHERDLVVGDDGHVAITGLALGAADVDLDDLLLRASNDVLGPGAKERTELARGRDDERHLRGAIGGETRDQFAELVTGQHALARAVLRVEVVGEREEDIKVPRELAASFRRLEAGPKDGEFLLDRRVVDAVVAARVNVAVDVARRQVGNGEEPLVAVVVGVSLEEATQDAGFLQVVANRRRRALALRDEGVTTGDEAAQDVAERRGCGTMMGISSIGLPLRTQGERAVCVFEPAARGAALAGAGGVVKDCVPVGGTPFETVGVGVGDGC